MDEHPKKCPAYSFVTPLTYHCLGEKTFSPPSVKKSYDNSLYISLCYIEEWAFSKGFHSVENMLRDQGISYWKGGKYFSIAQLLIYLNGMRLEKRLEPFSVS